MPWISPFTPFVIIFCSLKDLWAKPESRISPWTLPDFYIWRAGKYLFTTEEMERDIEAFKKAHPELEIIGTWVTRRRYDFPITNLIRTKRRKTSA